MKYIYFLLLMITVVSCTEPEMSTSHSSIANNTTEPAEEVTIVVLGNAQDAGSPQIGCEKDCCKELFKTPDQTRRVVSVGVVDPFSKKKFLFEASPDFVHQTQHLAKFGFDNERNLPDGIFLTHAHIGHYTGLMYLGKEALNADSTPVYTYPRMKSFLETNGPWSQLVSSGNIWLQEFPDFSIAPITEHFRVKAFKVPHRDEYSETIGFILIGPNKSALFIPDIDKWEKWDEDIIKEISKVDYAFIDATFYDGAEIHNRDIAEIPHPFVIESMKLFKDLNRDEKNKIHFIHFNHTNPLLDKESKQSKKVESNGFNIARLGDQFTL